MSTAKELILIHTAEAHRVTFDALRDRIAPAVRLVHLVRSDWLAQARRRITPALERAVAAAVAEAGGPVICTCTTIGPLAEAAGAIRVDGPMMQAAARSGGPIVLAYALTSTWAPSLALLERALAAEGRRAVVHPLDLSRFWPLFEAGEQEAFAAVIAAEIRRAASRGREIGAVVLAQVSMAGAAALLDDLDVPVLASPELALRAALALPAGPSSPAR